MTKSAFLNAARAAAHASSTESGLPAAVTVAQAALESAWGASRLSREANNYFGIKYRPGCNEDFIELPTREECNGTLTQTTARFARFASIEACFRARDHIILTLPCYSEARACCGSPEQFMAALAKHWATDLTYAAKLTAVYAVVQTQMKPYATAIELD